MKTRRLLKLALPALPILVVLLVSVGAQNAHAAGKTFTVNDQVDAVDANPGDGICATADGKCSLRAAVQEANATTGADTIVVPSGTYKLTLTGANEDFAATGDLDILEGVTIQGAGSSTTIIDGLQADRVFETYPAVDLGHINISGLTIENGVADYGGAILANAHQGATNEVTLTDVVISNSHATLAGGGINNHAKMTISRSKIIGNRAASGDIGGGIFNTGDLTISDSTISGNSAAGVGGGLYNVIGPAAISGSTFSGNSAGIQGGGVANIAGAVTMTNVTFSGNTAGSAGGGIYNGAAGSQMTLLNATLAGDSAPSAEEISHDNTGPFHLKNTIIAGATPGKNCAGTLSSEGHNLASDATCGLTQGGDKKNADPMLGALGDNGGPTQTLALLAGSPAIDAGSSDCPPPATDQRGVSRPQGPACDIGAFEFQSAPPGTSRIWGDGDCGGDIGPRDAQAVLKNVLVQSPLSQTQPCPAVGSTVVVDGVSRIWSDWDCGGDIGPRDAQAILKDVLVQSPLSQTQPCPAVGSTVQVVG